MNPFSYKKGKLSIRLRRLLVGALCLMRAYPYPVSPDAPKAGEGRVLLAWWMINAKGAKYRRVKIIFEAISDLLAIRAAGEDGETS